MLIFKDFKESLNTAMGQKKKPQGQSYKTFCGPS